jgi:hypothetical protein
MGDLKNERLRRRDRERLDRNGRAHEASELIPRRVIRTPQIEASDAMLLYSFAVRQFFVPFLIVAEDDPILRTDYVEPLVILSVVIEPIARIVVPLNSKRRLRLLDRFRKALTEISVEIKG